MDCGLIHKVSRVSNPAFPLKAYIDFSSFKLFLVDIGLLSAMGSVDVKTMLKGTNIFKEFKGAITEQYVLQQLVSEKEFVTYYWSAERSSAEIDFLIQFNGKHIPVEVKAEENLQAKSLKVFCEKYNPVLAVRTSMSGYRQEDWLTNISLYAISEIKGMQQL